MKKQKNKFLVCLLLIVGFVVSPAANLPAQALVSSSDRLLSPEVQALFVNDTKTLFVDKEFKQVQLFDVLTGKVEWTKKFGAVYDCEVLLGSGKIVVLTDSGRQLQKQVFTTTGKVVSTQNLPGIKKTAASQIQWSAAGAAAKESIAVTDGQQLSLYQYPWKKPVQSLSLAASEDQKHENAIVQDVQFQFSYVIAKVNGMSLGQTNEYYKIMNVTTRQLKLITPGSNARSSFVTEGTALVVNTSSISGTPLGIETNTPQILYARYDLHTGQMTKSLKRTFTQSDSNWSSSYFAGRLLLTDTEKSKQSFLAQDGKLIAERSSTPTHLRDKLIASADGKAVILVPTANQGTELQKPFY